MGDIAVQTCGRAAWAMAATGPRCTRTGRSGVLAADMWPAIALRAAGAESPFARPASFFCHYLSVAAFAPVELVVTPLRSGRTVLAQRVEMTQDGRAVLDAMVWSVGQVEGLEHVDVAPPAVSDPADTPPWTARRQDGDDAEAGDDDHRPYRVLGQLRAATTRRVGHVAATWTAAADLARLGPLQGGRSRTERCLGAGRPPARRPRRRELAGGLEAARPRQPALHCAQPRSVCRLRGSDERLRVAAARRPLPGGPGRTALVDGPGLVRDAHLVGSVAVVRRCSATPDPRVYSAV